MDYEKLSRELKQATLFDLWRLNSTIDLMLNDPQRIRQVKRQLKVGMTISYFEDSENRLVDAEIVAIRRTRVSVRNLHDLRKWDLPFSMLNLGDASVDLSQLVDHKNVSRASLKVGDQVGWTHNNGDELYGVVIKLNPARAVIKLSNNDTWRVSYAMLFAVLDGNLENSGDGLLLDSVEFTLLDEE